MKPLTAEDLVVGGKYVPHSKSVGDTFDTFKKECLIRNEPFILEHVDNFRNDYWFKTSQNRRYIFLPSDVTPYHEPNECCGRCDGVNDFCINEKSTMMKLQSLHQPNNNEYRLHRTTL
jgi:hypothetical protein